MTTQKLIGKFGAAIAVTVAVAFGLAAPTWAAEKKAPSKEAEKTLEVFKKADPDLKKGLDEAAAYVVFPAIAKGAVGVGAAAGDGVLYEKGKETGSVKMTQVTVGAQLGGQSYSELILIKDAATLDNFKKGNVEFSAQASAVAIKAGASTTADYENGVKVFTIAKSGLMFEASVGGQTFKYTPYKAEKLGLR